MYYDSKRAFGANFGVNDDLFHDDLVGGRYA